MMSPQNHGFSDLAEGLMADPTRHQSTDEGEDYDDGSSDGSMQGSNREHADDVKAADSAV